MVPVLAGLFLALGAAGCNGGAETVANNDNSDGTVGANHAPTISGGAAPAVSVDRAWSFTPDAADADGDLLEFAVENAPSWATFDSSTGQLAGTPAIGDVGTYANISVSVSDGSLSASLDPFSVEVTQVALGSVTVAWSLPSLYDDGSALSGHVVGLNVYYGVDPGIYPNKIEISNIGTTTYIVENLVPDTYHFVATIVDDQGTESGWSNIGSATID